MSEIKVKLSQSHQSIGGVSIDQNNQGIGISVSSGGLAEVVHDDTLKGKGTRVHPLGVADAVLEDIDSRVEKTDEADKIYGTDSQGNQTIYDKDSFGQVDDVKVNGVSVVENKIANISVPTKTSEITNDSGFITKAVDNLDNYTKTVDLSTVATSGSYNDLDDTPTIGSGTLTIQKNGTTIGTFGANQTTNETINILADTQVQADWAESDSSKPDYIKNKPTNVSDFTNDADYQNGTQVSNTVSGAISTHNTSNDAHSNLLTPITQDIDAIEEKIPAEASSSNQLADKAYVDSKVGDLNEWTTEQYTATTTNFVVGNIYTVEEAFQRTASLFEGQQGEIDDIEALIPAQATTQNQLADKSFVNATVATNSANFRGNWATWAYVPTDGNLYPEDYVGNRTPTNNDYMVVDDAIGYGSEYDGSWRFIYIGTWATDGKNGWNPVYRIGTAFTQEQQAAIDSGITANMVDNYVNPNSTAATAYNARITAVETDKRDIINSANKVYATDANGANKNDLVYDKTATADTIAQRGTNGVLKVGTPVDNADATTKQYVDAISGDLDEHIADKNNPHEVTKAQVGLGNVDNTSDLNKPISTATQTALNSKQDVISDLSTIRSGAALGATAVQPGGNISVLTNDSGFITSASVATLTDVQLTSLADGDALIYDANSSKWVNGNGGVSATYDATTKTITFA